MCTHLINIAFGAPTENVGDVNKKSPVTGVSAHVLSIVALLMLLILPALHPVQAIPGANFYSPEGDFQASTCTSSSCSPWIQQKWGSNTAKFSIVNDGTKAAKLAVTKFKSGAALWQHPHVNVPDPNTMYRYTVRVKTPNNTTTAFAEVEYVLTNGNYRYLPLSAVGPTNSQWVTFSDDFLPPADAASFTIYVFLRSNGTVLIDDVSIQPLASDDVALNRPLVSISMDDGTGDIYNNAFPLLSQYGFDTTQFIIAGSVGDTEGGFMTQAEIQTLHDNGFERASHSYTHESLVGLNSTQLTNETAGAQALLRSDFPCASVATPPNPWLPCTFNQFAYPYGDTNQIVINQLMSATSEQGGKLYRSARGTEDGLNTKYGLSLNPIPTPPYANQSMPLQYRLKAQIVLNPDLPDWGQGVPELQGWLDRAAATKTWLNIIYHDTSDTPDEYGLVPSEFSAHLAAIAASGICVTTIEQALNEIQYGQPAAGVNCGSGQAARSTSPSSILAAVLSGVIPEAVAAADKPRGPGIFGRAKEPTKQQMRKLHAKFGKFSHDVRLSRKTFKQSRFSLGQ